MIASRSDEYLINLIHELCKQPVETTWLEFERNQIKPQLIGEYLSALANSAALLEKPNAYIIWGVHDTTHEIVGTTFKPATEKVGNEQLENWLLRLLEPKINFNFLEVMVDEHPVVILDIGAAFRHPVQFQNQEFIRVGSYTKKLKEHPERERKLWRIFDKVPFEKSIAAEHVSGEDILKLLDCLSWSGACPGHAFWSNSVRE